ncbi:MAG: DUF2225 domain-containing protein [Nitrospirae bacterium]|nr:DUF2225 domain-containing protein [Nitrospirota bacterium]
MDTFGKFKGSDILTAWRLEELFGHKPSEPPEPIVPPKPLRYDWSDEASKEAEERLRGKGINVHWHYGDSFGDDFKVIGLRAGNIGVVFLVESTRFGGKRLYAAKTLRKFLESDYLSKPTYEQKDIADDFLEEALPWLEMGQHANIVAVHLLQNIIHPETKRNIPFVFSEFMGHGNLSDHLIRKSKLDFRETIVLGIQLCDGLLHAYEHGNKYGFITHRDLKPDNVMVYRESIFKVTDFSAGVIGTPGYMTPEQVTAMYRKRGINLTDKELPIDHRADQFTIGLIMHDAFKGGNPQNEQKKRMDYIDSDPERFVREGFKGVLSDDLPVLIRDIINRCLQPEIKDRYANLSILKNELLNAYGDDYRSPEVEPDDSAEWWFNRGMAFYNIGRYASGELPFKNSLKRLENITGTEISQATCLLNLGSVYISIGQFEKAEKHYKDALKMFKAITGTEIDQATCLMNLGIVYVNTGQFEKAEKYYKDALKMFKAIPGTEISQARCLMNLGFLYSKVQEFNKARQALDESLKICNQYPLGTEGIKKACLKMLGQLQKTVEQQNVDIPAPHHAAGPEHAAHLNIQYHQELSQWKSLPWWKRLKTKKPDPPG